MQIGRAVQRTAAQAPPTASCPRYTPQQALLLAQRVQASMLLRDAHGLASLSASRYAWPSPSLLNRRSVSKAPAKVRPECVAGGRGIHEGDRELKGTRSVVQGQRMASSTRGRHRFEHTLLIVLICASLARLAASPDTSDAGQGIRERGRGTDSATGAQGMAAYSGGRKEDALRLFAQVLFGYCSRG